MNKQERENQIKEILSRNKIVRFTLDGTDITKDVMEWNPDNLGDLTAFRTKNAMAKFVMWESEGYKISEVAP